MTVITALREGDDSVLIACDSGAHESAGGIRITIPQKLQRQPQGALAWATAGDTSVGDDFTAWLKKYPWPAASWQAFKADAIAELARLNGAQREMIRLSGLEPDEFGVAVGLVVGWTGGEPNILELAADGKVTSYLEDGFKAIGSGESHALIAHITLKPFTIDPVERLRYVTQTAATLAQKCDLPVHVWRVTQVGVEEIE